MELNLTFGIEFHYQVKISFLRFYGRRSFHEYSAEHHFRLSCLLYYETQKATWAKEESSKCSLIAKRNTTHIL